MAEILAMYDSKDGGARATQEAKAEDAYKDVGDRQRLEHVVEQLPVNAHLIILNYNFRKFVSVIF